jgi:aspartyl-tRNA(Asn)/glutamyl-tRNA(Gln) amidotransferase subunit A
MTSHSESELAYLTIVEAARLLRRKEISPVDLVEVALSRIDRWNPAVDAFITVLADSARRKARAAEREIRRGDYRGPLHGIPISLKDNFCTRGILTTAGSKILAGFVPGKDSDVSMALSSAGAILLGKTNMHEFAYGITGENPHYGTPRNPWDTARITGGSSSGSAAAVATGMGFASLGTDTGGSIRIPSALCGITGLKPTYGSVSNQGTIPLAPSFDHVGPLARNVTDACIVFEAIAGKYPQRALRPHHRKLRANRARKIRVGLPRHYYFDSVDPDVFRLVRAAAKHLESLGARIEEVPLPHLPAAIQSAMNLNVAEASHYHDSQGYFPARAVEYGADVRGHLEWGHNLRAVDYLRGVVARDEIEQDFASAFADARVDVILAPTSPITAPLVGTTEVRSVGERETTVRAELLRFTRPTNLTGHPSISIPCGFIPAGLPAGLQLIAPKWHEAQLLSIALAYEDSTEWHSRRPDLASI